LREPLDAGRQRDPGSAGPRSARAQRAPAVRRSQSVWRRPDYPRQAVVLRNRALQPCRAVLVHLLQQERRRPYVLGVRARRTPWTGDQRQHLEEREYAPDLASQSEKQNRLQLRLSEPVPVS